MVSSSICADILNVAELPVIDTDGRETSPNGCPNLRHEDKPGRDLAVMCKLQVGTELNRLSGGNIAKHLEDHVGNGLASHGVTSNKLSHDVQGDFVVGHGHDHAQRHLQGQGEGDGQEDTPDGEAGRVVQRRDASHNERNCQESQVPRLGAVLVFLHQAVVDVIEGIAGALEPLATLEAVRDGMIANLQIVPVVDEGVADGGGVSGKEEHVEHSITGREVRRAVGLVGFFIQGEVWVQHLGNI